MSSCNILGFIYRVYYDNVEECYIGKTTMIPAQRLVKHINRYHSNAERQSSVSSLFLQHGVARVKIDVIEELENCTDQEMSDRERFWIEHTPGAVNVQKPQPAETSQCTTDGKKAYMLAYKEVNEEDIKIKEKEYKSRPEVKERAKEQKKEWASEHSERLNAKKKERITCDKCKKQIPLGHKHEHTAEKCAKIISDEVTRQQHRLKAKELSETLTLRDIVKHPYFVATGKFKNHSEISRLIKELYQ
jgi:hypothetical protein